MPDYKIHIIFAFFLSAISYFILRQVLVLDLKTAIVTIIIIGFAAIFPDIDHKNSKVHKWVKTILILVSVIAISILLYPNLYLTVVFSTISSLILYGLLTWLKPRHRGPTHTINFSIFFTIATGLITFFLLHTLIPALFCFLSYNSHVFLDKIVQEI